MKNKFKYILMTACVCGAMNLVSCSSDFMDVKPHDQYDQEAVFEDAGLTQSLVNSISTQRMELASIRLPV